MIGVTGKLTCSINGHARPLELVPHRLEELDLIGRDVSVHVFRPTWVQCWVFLCKPSLETLLFLSLVSAA